MRQFFALSLMALLFASCQRDGLISDTAIEQTQSDDKFGFSAAGEDATTRALDNTKLESFSVFTAVTYDRAQENAGVADPSVSYDPTQHTFNWMYNTHIKKSSDGSTWEYVAPASGVTESYIPYWKNNAKHSFFALSPYEAVNGNGLDASESAKVTPAMGDTGAFSFDYTVPSTLLAAGSDLMVASQMNIGGKDINSAFAKTVELNFKHALAQISFSVSLNSEGQEMLVATKADGTLMFPDAKIKVHGIGFTNVSTSGTLTFDPAAASVPTGETNPEAPFSWTPVAENATMQWTDTEIEHLKNYFIGSSEHTVADVGETHLGDKGTINVIPAEVGGKNHIALMIPQEFNSEAKLVLAYHQNLRDLEGGELGHEQDIVKEIAAPIAPILSKIEPGQRYHIHITFDFTEGYPTMNLKASPYDWNEEVVNGDIEGGTFVLDNHSRIYNLPTTQQTLDIPFTTTYLEEDFYKPGTADWNITCSEGSAIIDYANSKIIYQAPAGGLTDHHASVTFTVRSRSFTLDVFSGDFSFGDTKQVIIPDGQNSVKVYYTSTYDHTKLAPEVMAKLFKVDSYYGAEVVPTFESDDPAYDGFITYTKPADADANSIYSDYVSANVAGVDYVVQIFWGYFRLDAVNDPRDITVTMADDANQVSIPLFTNYTLDQITAVNADLQRGRVVVTDGVDGPVIHYTSLALDIAQDVITVVVAGQEYTINVNMKSLTLDEGGLEIFTGIKVGHGHKYDVKFKTDFTQVQLQAGTITTENGDAGVTIDSFVTSSPNTGLFKYLSTGRDALDIDRVTVSIAGREYVYSILTQ